jgi:hypothetical protein
MCRWAIPICVFMRPIIFLSLQPYQPGAGANEALCPAGLGEELTDAKGHASRA